MRMTAQLSRERLEEIAALPLKTTSWGLEHAPGAYSTVYSHEIVEMARMLLAGMDCEPVGMDSEPVAVIDKEGNPMTRAECNDDRVFAICCKVGTPLYAAPPAPVAVPDEIDTKQAYQYMRSHSLVGCYRDGWNDCRAAMLKAGPVAVKCPKCGDTGLADSGGVQPWGEPISVACDCTITAAPEQEV